ncbi:odorant receptor 43a-like [Culicoides brevitarsis]|uniref:odorant receptor 43a-like n=1 Tax=Culicoides brevitarsis TaxID=469753 RepID=UPI00307C2337
MELQRNKNLDKNLDLTKIFKDFLRIGCEYQLKISGHWIFGSEFRWNIRSIITWIDAIAFLCIGLTNIWTLRQDMKSVCYCLVTYGYGITGSLLWFNIRRHRDIFKDIFDTICRFGETLERDPDENDEEIRLYLKYGKLCKTIGIGIVLFWVISGVILVLYPVFVYFYNGSVVLPFELLIPGLSSTQNPGYFITLCYQYLQLVIAVPGYSAHLNLFFLYVMMACFQIDLMSIKLTKLNEALVKSTEIDEKIIKITKLYQDLMIYIGKLEKLFKTQTFVDFVIYTFASVMTLYVIVKFDNYWIIGYALEATIIFMLFIPSLFGTMIEVMNNRLVVRIYQVSWYLLKPRERKSFRFLLEYAQNGTMLSCGGYFPLNLVLFQSTFNRIYSYLMFLMDTSE